MSQLTEEEDPLGLKELALNYDYLIYKMNDHMNNLSELTYTAVKDKEILVNEYLEKKLQLDKEMKEIDSILQKCEELELEFMKLDQLSSFIEGFKKRLDTIESQLT